MMDRFLFNVDLRIRFSFKIRSQNILLAVSGAHCTCMQMKGNTLLWEIHARSWWPVYKHCNMNPRTAIQGSSSSSTHKKKEQLIVLSRTYIKPTYHQNLQLLVSSPCIRIDSERTRSRNLMSSLLSCFNLFLICSKYRFGRNSD